VAVVDGYPNSIVSRFILERLAKKRQFY